MILAQWPREIIYCKMLWDFQLCSALYETDLHYSKKLKEHFDIMIFIERYPLKRCQGCVKLIASKVNCFLNINDLSEVQLCMSSNSWTWECPHTKDGADHVPLIFLSSVLFPSPGSPSRWIHQSECVLNYQILQCTNYYLWSAATERTTSTSRLGVDTSHSTWNPHALSAWKQPS